MRLHDWRAALGAQAVIALLAAVIGHAAAAAIVVASVLWGVDRGALQWSAAAMCVGLALVHLWRRTAWRARATTGHAGLALSCFLMSTAHGAGLALVPALLPLCEGLSSRV